MHGDAARDMMRARRGGVCSRQGPHKVATRGTEAEVSGTLGHERNEDEKVKRGWLTHRLPSVFETSQTKFISRNLVIQSVFQNFVLVNAFHSFIPYSIDLVKIKIMKINN